MPKRRGFKPSEHFKDRLRKMRERGARDGVAPASRQEEDDMLRKARQADTASHLDDWLNSPRLQPPK